MIFAITLTLFFAQSTPLALSGRLKAGDDFIDVTVGHAAPFMKDMNGDGLMDLLVGEFGDEDFPVSRLPDSMQDSKPGQYSQGKLRVYLNQGTASVPKYEAFAYLQAGGEDASVPTT
jgi:hypothetical protein